MARGRWRWQHGGAAPTRALREHVPGGLGSSRCCSPQCLCQERRLCSPAVTLPPSRGSPSAFCLPLAPRCAQCGGQKIPCTHVRSCSIPQSSPHRPQEGADRGTSALGDAPVQASGSQGSVISTQLDQELHWGGFWGFLFLFFSKQCWVKNLQEKAELSKAPTGQERPCAPCPVRSSCDFPSSPFLLGVLH